MRGMVDGRMSWFLDVSIGRVMHGIWMDLVAGLMKRFSKGLNLP